MSTVMPRSALRHRPLAQNSTEFAISKVEVLTPRVTRQKSPDAAQMPRRNQRPLTLVGISMVVTFLLLCVIGNLWTWGNEQLDTIRYGYPRTTQGERAVGHNGISTFLATNQHGQIYVLEIPGGNPAGSHLLVGPRLIGLGADLAPVTLLFQGDPRHPDLVIEVDGISKRFHNTGTTYVLAAAS